ncbi:nitrite reductase large subunit NirB [Metabacillus sediminilitoris]|uniref:NAD(P)/FAD-dependent oxidoreductase n=1 Tax=Metabacillus sediminilitoris TaxID=2567941 RepID=A0A4S4BNB2_9BACI|nr:nitrite reductase large subunit NirB [Metabacillus sediminilitoris]QGQ48429.1 NAD(P)/FAD-dependent oxidoreductase [Metabacillus sediminilitoris]THF76325.1 NAD(P)/FAD-dependent oxidoreductase [Metabacillus sediminilitoris]
MKQKLVVIGNGMAGIRCVEEILKQNSSLFDISIIGSEPHLNYNRILLSSVLQGETTFQDISIHSLTWYEENGIKLFSGETVVNIDDHKKQIETDKKRIINYDKVIIATGSIPFVLPIPGSEKDGVVTFRTIDDCKEIIETSKHYKKAVVIGGGVLGLEAARGLVNLGLEVKVIHNSAYLMERQLDSISSTMLQKELEKQGMEFLLGKVTKEIIGDHRVREIQFTDGTSIETDFVVMSVGVRPNIELAKKSGILTNRGIIVNDYLKTNKADIYAVGECVEHKGVIYGLVKPLYEQGKVLAKHICGLDEQGYKGTVLSTSLKVPGVDLFSVGEFAEDDTTTSLKILNEVDGVYKKIVIRDDMIVGAVLYGNTADQSKLLDMIIKRKYVSDEEKRSLLQTADTNGPQIKSMKLTEIICNCNGVSKGAIMEAVQQKELTTVEQVKQCTKASGSCGGCKSVVSDLLHYIHSDECNETIQQKSLCTCTSLTEDEVVLQIQQRNLFKIQDVFKQLEWKTSEGCSSCVPAINYYLAMIYPENETYLVEGNMKAQLQRDGTYSIIPQMYGGKTNAEELQKISHLMKKYNLTDVGFTPDQRIQINGIKKEELHAVYSELNMPLRAAQKHTIRLVNNSFGEQYCQCHKENALQLSIDMEKELDYLLTPHNVVLAVAACKHSPVDLLTKDFSVIGFNRGWEIYVGGSISPQMKQGELFTVAKHDQDAKELICGLVQYYRETANYLEQVSDWVDRVGLIHIREVLFDDVLRGLLLERLEAEKFAFTGQFVK